MSSIMGGVVVPGVAVLLTAWPVLSILAAESDPGAFNSNCRTCHSVKKGDHRLGPSLHSVFGAKAGSSSSYAGYSQGLKDSGVIWDEATLDKFIENPDQVIPNNNMKPFKGVGDPAVRKRIIAFLKSQSASP